MITGFWTPTLAEFQAFAALSGDANPIHLDPDYCKTHPFGRPVSHGMLIHAQLWALAARHGLMPGPVQRLVFPAPAYAGEALTLMISSQPGGHRAEARRADRTPVYDADWRVAA